jgi:site-specific recombinase XerD
MVSRRVTCAFPPSTLSFGMWGTRHPDQLSLVHGILGIPFKRARERAVEYLEYEEIEAVLSAIAQKTLDERRDYALLATMFNTAARVQEIVDLRGCDLQLTRPFQVRILGKGRKERFCPLWAQTAKTLRAFCTERNLDLRSDAKVFLNHRGEWLTRFGVRYILAKYLRRARARLPNLAKKRLHPHSMRHYLPSLTMSCKSARARFSRPLLEAL